MDNETDSILRLLIENKDKKFSIRKLALLRKINYKSAYMAVMKLKKENIISLEKAGNTTQCSFNNNFNSRVFSVELARKNELVKNKNFKIIYNRLEEISLPFILLLFGSYAKMTQKKNSDIDLLLISENPKQVEEVLSLIPLKIHLTAINYKEFISMARSKEFSVVSEAVKNNIILIGIEEYYRLLKNAENR